MKIPLKIYHWLPRIICTGAIFFISIFAADASVPGLSLWKQIGDFFLHLIPSFILIIFLLIAWKWELAGGIFFLVIGIGMSPVIFLHNQNVNHFPVHECIMSVLLVTFPFIVAGIMFIISYLVKKKYSSP